MGAVSGGALQLSSLLPFGIYNNNNNNSSRRFIRNVKSSAKLRRGLLFSAANLPWQQQQYSWSSNVSKRIHRRVCTIPFRCHCFFNPSLNNATAFTLPRSLQGTPVLIKFTSALGIFLFAIWGLPPLVQLSRNISLHKTDNSWKKSSTFHVTTSYIQPLLLWGGAILICRALDPMLLPTEAAQIVKQRLLNFVKSLSTVLAFAYCLSSVIQQAQKFMMEKNDPADTRNMGFQFAGRALYTAVWVAAVSLFMELLGFSTQKWLTAGGLGTVLLTLAGREIFTNFLSSAMIHATRPFVVNEWIQTKIEGYEVSGTVEHVGWWSPTIVRGEDREAVHIPNHKFTVNVVRNLSQKTHWRIKTHLAISHLDVSKINNIVADMRKVLAKNPQVEQQKLHRRVFLDNINPENQALLILVSCFVKTSHFEEYLCVKEAILLDLLRVIRHHRARLATPIRTVQKIFNDADLDNVPFSDSVFNRGAVSNRPFLLIEPSYKINGEDKTKTQARPMRVNGEEDSKPNSKSTSDSKVDAIGESTPSNDSKSRETVATDFTTKETPTSDTKADSEVRQTPRIDTKEDPKVAAKFSDPKLKNNSTKSGSKPDTKSDEETNSNASTSGQTTQTQKASSKKHPPKIGDDNTLASSPESGVKRSDSVSSTKQSPATKPSLEENLVLGVALEGSKRTLPIEEETAPSPNVEDVKKLAALRSVSGTAVTEKDKNDTKRSISPGSSPAVDQVGQQE